MKKILFTILMLCTGNMYAQTCSINPNVTGQIDCIGNTITASGTLSLSSACTSIYDFNSLNNPPGIVQLQSQNGQVVTTGTATLQPSPVNPRVVNLSVNVDLKSVTLNDQKDKIASVTISFSAIKLFDKSTVSSTIVLTAQQLIPVGSIDGYDTLNVNQQGTFDFQSGASAYVWTENPGFAIIRNPMNYPKNTVAGSWDQPGTKNLMLTVQNGACQASYTKNITVNAVTTGINDVTLSKVSIVNPVRNHEVLLSKIVGDIRISNLNGTTLVTAQNSDKLSVHLNSGIYLIFLDGEVQKLIVE